MIQASELRIGNLVFLKSLNKNYTIECGFDIEKIEDGEDALPIPLTEEWLIKFGFEKIGYEWRLKQGWHWISVDKNSFYILGKQLGLLENVHQLQNLYFALTGEELEIKGGNNE